MAKFALSPSRIARYYFLECDRFLRFMSVPRERRKEEGIPKMEPDYSPVAQAVLEGGYDWEQEVIANHLQGNVVVPEVLDPEAPFHERKMSYGKTLSALRNLVPGESIYQPTLVVPPAFYERHGVDPDLIEFRECYPDLVMCVDGDHGPELRVIDVKASNWMKLSHRIQVGVYTLILGEVLRQEGIPTHIARAGGVWLYGVPEPEWFNLANVIPPLETFLTDDLPRVITAEKEAAFWHLNFRCEWCEYFTHCRIEAAAEDSVSQVPYLSHFAKRHLVEVGNIETVDDLGLALEGPDTRELVAGCASLEGRIRQLRQSVKALQSGTPLATGAASVSMPKGENIRVVLTVQPSRSPGRCMGTPSIGCSARTSTARRLTRSSVSPGRAAMRPCRRFDGAWPRTSTTS
jgi:hypothetical protein